MSSILARVMLSEPLEERRVLEVGCGLALPSIVVRNLGGDITASDYHPLARSFLSENLKLNSLAAIPFRNSNWNISTLRPNKFDLIIGSDLLYEEVSIELLSSFVDNHLTRSGHFILIDPGRGFHRKYARAMKTRGFEHEWTDLQLYPQDGLKQNGFIFRFARSAKSPCGWF